MTKVKSQLQHVVTESEAPTTISTDTKTKDGNSESVMEAKSTLRYLSHGTIR